MCKQNYSQAGTALNTRPTVKDKDHLSLDVKATKALQGQNYDLFNVATSRNEVTGRKSGQMTASELLLLNALTGVVVKPYLKELSEKKENQADILYSLVEKRQGGIPITLTTERLVYALGLVKKEHLAIVSEEEQARVMVWARARVRAFIKRLSHFGDGRNHAYQLEAEQKLRDGELMKPFLWHTTSVMSKERAKDEKSGKAYWKKTLSWRITINPQWLEFRPSKTELATGMELITTRPFRVRLGDCLRDLYSQQEVTADHASDTENSTIENQLVEVLKNEFSTLIPDKINNKDIFNIDDKNVEKDFSTILVQPEGCKEENEYRQRNEGGEAAAADCENFNILTIDNQEIKEYNQEKTVKPSIKKVHIVTSTTRPKKVNDLPKEVFKTTNPVLHQYATESTKMFERGYGKLPAWQYDRLREYMEQEILNLMEDKKWTDQEAGQYLSEATAYCAKGMAGEKAFKPYHLFSNEGKAYFSRSVYAENTEITYERNGKTITRLMKKGDPVMAKGCFNHFLYTVYPKMLERRDGWNKLNNIYLRDNRLREFVHNRTVQLLNHNAKKIAKWNEEKAAYSKRVGWLIYEFNDHYEAIKQRMMLTDETETTEKLYLNYFFQNGFLKVLYGEVRAIENRFLDKLRKYQDSSEVQSIEKSHLKKEAVLKYKKELSLELRSGLRTFWKTVLQNLEPYHLHVQDLEVFTKEQMDWFDFRASAIA